MDGGEWGSGCGVSAELGGKGRGGLVDHTLQEQVVCVCVLV